MECGRGFKTGEVLEVGGRLQPSVSAYHQTYKRVMKDNPPPSHKPTAPAEGSNVHIHHLSFDLRESPMLNSLYQILLSTQGREEGLKKEEEERERRDRAQSLEAHLFVDGFPVPPLRLPQPMVQSHIPSTTTPLPAPLSKEPHS